MADSSSERNPVEALAEEFVERHRRGEHPALTEYTTRYPQWADEIRDLFPALVLMEKNRPQADEATGPHAGTALGDESRLERLGDYRILREVGRGGMGIVYEAEQESLGRHVALKVLPAAALLNPKHLQRFQRESKAAARLHHTNIVPVYGVGVHDGVHYYVMQFIQGLALDEVLTELRRLRQARQRISPHRPSPTVQPEDLSALAIARSLLTGEFALSEPSAENGAQPASEKGVRAKVGSSSGVHLPGQSEGSALSESGRQYWQSVARIGVQVADALAYASSQGILHRDIKPSNLLLDTHGTVWITDFGLAKASDNQELTHTGDIVGTLRYMAPERFQGQCDIRSDVYSLGLTLYELITLRPAFDETDRHILLQQVMHDEPPRPRRLNPTLPRDLETIVLKALEREPAKRYPTATVLAEDLQRFLAGEPIRARRIGSWERTVKWAKRRPAIAALLTCIVCITLMGFALVTWQWQRAQEAGRTAEAKAAAEAEANENLKRALYFERIARADREWSANNLKQVEQLLDACPLDLRGWEWRYLKRLRLQRVPPMRHSCSVLGVAFSPDSRWIASGGEDGMVKVWDANTGLLADELQAHKFHVRTLAFSSDGHHLATGSWDQTAKVWVFDPERTREKHRLLHAFGAHGDQVESVAFSPDSKSLASAGHDNAVRIWDLTSGREIFKHQRPGKYCPCFAYSPDGLVIASSSPDKTVRIWQVMTDREVFTLPHSVPIMSIRFSHDGRWLITTSADTSSHKDGEIIVWNVRTGSKTRTLRGHTSYLHVAIFSPDGRRIASAGADEDVKVWDLQTGRDLLTLHGHRPPVRDLAFSADGTRLVSASQDQSVLFWDARPLGSDAGQELYTLHGHQDGVRSVAFSPDGRWLASLGNDGKVLVWDLQRARAGGSNLLMRTLAGRPGFKTLQFSHNGRMLAAGGSQSPVNLVVWDTATWNELMAQPVGPGCAGVAFSPDDGCVAMGAFVGDGFPVAIVDLATKQVVRILRGHTWAVWVVAYSPNPDLPYLASAGGDGTVRIWDVLKEKEIHILPHCGGLGGLAFSHDGCLVASGGNDRVVKIWDTATGQLRHHRLDPTGTVARIAFHPKEARVLAWGSHDGTVKIWNTALEEIRILHGHMSWVEDVAFSPDGEWLASASLDGSVKIWKMPR